MLTFIAPCYQYTPILPYCLVNQTDPDWQLLMAHDGPNDKYTRLVEELNDPRIELYFTKERLGNWGHPIRQMLFNNIPANTDYLVVTNGDNYYINGFVAQVHNAFDADTDMVYCDCLHNYEDWNVMYTDLHMGQIDCGCVAVRYHIAKEIGWKSNANEADWHFISEIIDKVGLERCRKINKILFVHN